MYTLTRGNIMRNLIPVEFQKYYKPTTIDECEQAGFYMEDYKEGEAPEAFKYYPELEFLGWALGRPEYQDALQEYALVCIVKDNEKNDITLVQDVGDRIYDVEYDTIQSYVSSVESDLKH